MGFLGLRRAKWKHPDLEVRLRGVNELADSAQGTFQQLALEDPEPRVRASAASRVSDPAALGRLSTAGDEAVKRIARERLSGAAERLLKTQPLANCGAALETVNDQKSLAELALSAGDAAVRSAALAKILALESPSQALLSTIAIQDANGDSGLEALRRIDRRNSLRDIARKAKHPKIREAAHVRASASVIDETRPSSESLRRARRLALEPVLSQATRLAVSSNPLGAAQEFSAVLTQWSAALALADGISLDAPTQTMVDRFARLKLDITRKAEAETQRREHLVTVREALLTELSTRTPGDSTAMEVTARWHALPALAADQGAEFDRRFAAELQRLAPPPPEVPPLPLLSPTEQAELEALSTTAEALSLASDFHAVMPQWHILHKRWMTLAAPLPEHDPLKARFNTAWNAFKNRRREQRDQRDQMRSMGLETLRQATADALVLLERSKTIASHDQQALAALNQDLRELQSRWKSVGSVPGPEARALKQRFMAACDEAYGPIATNREAEDWERHRHLTAAQELIDAVEALAGSEDFPDVIDAVKQAHRSWKRLGPLPRDRQQATWLRFKTACDLQFDRCRPYLAEQDLQRVANLAQRQALISEVKALASQDTVGLAGSPADLAARRTAGERVKEIQAQWRDLGPVPREDESRIWQDFRQACDTFFGHVREADSLRRKEELANLQKKNDLCARAEDFASSAEAARSGHTGLLTPSDISRRARNLVEEWRTIGHVPRADMETVRTRFNTAMDRVWATIRDEQKAEEAAEAANLEQKLALIKQVEEILSDPNPRWFKDEVKAIQGKWSAIGDVPRAVENETVRRFEDLCRQVMRGK